MSKQTIYTHLYEGETQLSSFNNYHDALEYVRDFPREYIGTYCHEMDGYRTIKLAFEDWTDAVAEAEQDADDWADHCRIESMRPGL